MGTSVLLSFVKLLLADCLFLLILLAIAVILAKSKQASHAVMRRNFVGYFTNPTGYVFLCIFVFLTSLAAFWPYEFFNSNLATLDQLNNYFPLIMLFFIPAITMSIWAEEKRQGTDELLLTLPADDFDIVIGKYFAACAIFTASLIFSQLANFITLAILSEGALDIGLFFTTYLGYWFVGVTMIAIGMIASFLTGNLTVGFILGALFNAPLAFAYLSDAVVPTPWLARITEQMGLRAQFDDFGRGVISVAAIVYFVMVAAVGLYLCMVLIGRRHWTGGKDGNTMAWHYLARVLALVVITAGVVVTLRARDPYRLDTTEGQVSSLSPTTKELIRNLDAERPIVIDAFISGDIPEQYTRTRYELVNLLKEFRVEAAKQGKQIDVNLHQDIELFSDEAALAEDQFGIVPVSRSVRSRGAVRNERIIMGAAFRSGLEKVVVPFFESGIPVEYELVRSINTVARGGRKKLGVVTTDAQLMGGFSFAGMSPQQIPKHPLITELERQYDVEEVEFNSPITPGTYDVLLAVQPSSLAPEQFQRFVDAVKSGVPTAIFEDPFPWGMPGTPTGEPKQSPGGMFGGGSQMPKGNIRELWDALELEIPADAGMGSGLPSPKLVWQNYNPYPKLSELGTNDLWIFARDEAPGAEDPLNPEMPITDGLKELLFLYSGKVNNKTDGKLRHTPLVSTGARAGTIAAADVQANAQNPMLLQAVQGDFEGPQTVAMVVEGRTPASDSADDDAELAGDDAASAAGANEPIKAIYVADSDVMLQVFLQIRATPEQFAEIEFRFDNVTFLLNVVDWLAGELDYIEVRKHQPRFSTLQMIERIKERARAEESQARKEAQTAYEEAEREAQEAQDAAVREAQERLEEAQSKSQDGTISIQEVQRIAMDNQIQQQQEARRLEVKLEKLSLERDKKIRNVRREADLEIQKSQTAIKAFAVLLPCLPPLLIGLGVFANRRLRERETIDKARLK